MGDGLYPTRLRWHHNVGCARHDGVSVELHAAPGGLAFCTEIDFVPHVIAQVRERHDQMRHMTPAEMAHAMALLIRMSTDARDALRGQLERMDSKLDRLIEKGVRP